LSTFFKRLRLYFEGSSNPDPDPNQSEVGSGSTSASNSNQDPPPNPHQIKNQDPNPHQIKNQDPNPHQIKISRTIGKNPRDFTRFGLKYQNYEYRRVHPHHGAGGAHPHAHRGRRGRRVQKTPRHRPETAVLC
jgi:hypothetical protein